MTMLTHDWDARSFRMTRISWETASHDTGVNREAYLGEEWRSNEARIDAATALISSTRIR
jgi:hypothetical protein